MHTPHIVHIFRLVVLDAPAAHGAVEAGHVSLLAERLVLRLLQARLAEVSAALVAAQRKEVSSPAGGAGKTHVLEVHSGEEKGEV